METIVNGMRLHEAYRYRPEMVSTDQIQDALDAFQEWKDRIGYAMVYSFHYPADLDDVVKEIENLQDWQDSCSRFSDVKELNAYFQEEEEFFSNLTRIYEDYEGYTFGTMTKEDFAKYYWDDKEAMNTMKTSLSNIKRALEENDFTVEYLLSLIPSSI